MRQHRNAAESAGSACRLDSNEANQSTSIETLQGWGGEGDTTKHRFDSRHASISTVLRSGFDEPSLATSSSESVGDCSQERQTGKVPSSILPEEVEVDKHEVEKIVARVRTAM